MAEPSTPQTFHLWNQLPPELKTAVIKKMDGIDQLKTRQCSKTEKELVDKLPIITIQRIKFKIGVDGRTWTKVEQLKQEDSEIKIKNEIGETIFDIFSNPKIIVKNFAFFTTSRNVNRELKELSEAASATNIRLRAECVHFTLFQTSPKTATEILGLFDESCIKSIRMTASFERVVAAMSQTVQWKRCPEIVICDQKGLRLDHWSYSMINFSHFERINVMMEMLTEDEACIVIKNMQSKERGFFKIRTALSIKCDLIMKRLQPEIINKERIHDIRIYQFSMDSDPNLVLCVAMTMHSMKGVVCRREHFSEDFTAAEKMMNGLKVIRGDNIDYNKALQNFFNKHGC